MKEYQAASIGLLAVGARGTKVFFKSALKTEERPERVLTPTRSFFNQYGHILVLRLQRCSVEKRAVFSHRFPASVTVSQLNDVASHFIPVSKRGENHQSC